MMILSRSTVHVKCYEMTELGSDSFDVFEEDEMIGRNSLSLHSFNTLSISLSKLVSSKRVR